MKQAAFASTTVRGGGNRRGSGPLLDHRTIADPRLQAAQGQRHGADLRRERTPAVAPLPGYVSRGRRPSPAAGPPLRQCIEPAPTKTPKSSASLCPSDRHYWNHHGGSCHAGHPNTELAAGLGPSRNAIALMAATSVTEIGPSWARKSSHPKSGAGGGALRRQGAFRAGHLAGLENHPHQKSGAPAEGVLRRQTGAFRAEHMLPFPSIGPATERRVYRPIALVARSVRRGFLGKKSGLSRRGTLGKDTGNRQGEAHVKQITAAAVIGLLSTSAYAAQDAVPSALPQDTAKVQMAIPPNAVTVTDWYNQDVFDGNNNAGSGGRCNTSIKSFGWGFRSPKSCAAVH